jgi:hypothetical protein
VPEPSAFEFEINVVKLQRHKSPGTDQITTEFIKAGGRNIHKGIHKLTNSIWNKEELTEGWKEAIILPIYKKGDKTDCSNYRGISILPNT